MQIGCGKAHRKVALFFIPNELWKSAKWKQTEGLIRWSRFWCPGSNENQAASTIIHHHHAALHAPSQQSQYIGTAAEKVSEGLASEGSSLCLTSRRLVLLLLLFRLPQNHTIAYWFPPVWTRWSPQRWNDLLGWTSKTLGKLTATERRDIIIQS